MVDFFKPYGVVRWASMTRLMPAAASAAGPEIDTVTPIGGSGTAWRVTFVQPLLNNPALVCADSYVISDGVNQLRVLSVTPEDVAEPSYVDLLTDEHNAGTSYTLTIHSIEVA